jgi:hypothetical protein
VGSYITLHLVFTVAFPGVQMPKTFRGYGVLPWQSWNMSLLAGKDLSPEAVTRFWQNFFRESPNAHIEIEEIFGLCNSRCVMVLAIGKAAQVVGLKSAPAVWERTFPSNKVQDGKVFLNETIQVLITDIEASNGVSA